jgi:SH3-like domain-containing protein
VDAVAGLTGRRRTGHGTGLIFIAKSWFGQAMSEPFRRSAALRPACRHAVAGALALLLALAGVLAGVGGLSAQGTPAPAGATGLAVPRFVSLKSDRVNLRQGPGTEYPTAWVFRRAGLPVEVIKEFESWRQVRDAEGTTGWVLGSMLSGRRTAVILPWEVKAGQAQPALAVLRDDDSERASAVAQVEAGVLASIITCDGKWCRVSVGGFRGYIEQAKLWGAYKDEVIK